MAYKTEEGWHVVQDGTRMYTKTWKPEGSVRAKLVFVHGFSDHCNAYDPLFPQLAARGIVVCGYDERGWGRTVTTPASRGLTGPTSLVIADLASFMSSHLPSTVPIFLMGHSMGGGIVLTYAAQGPQEQVSQLRGLLTESPLLALAPTTAASKLTVLVGKLAGKVMPHYQLLQKLRPELLCRDPAVGQRFVDDPLCHDIGTLECLAAMLDRGQDLMKGLAPPAALPIWTSHGTGDQITDPKSSEQWTERVSRAKDKQFKSYEGWYHKLHAEPGQDKITYATDVADWILARSDNGSQAESGTAKETGVTKKDEEDEASRSKL